jgi:peptidoglycan hydrolase-like protein with peptidoglycan-binding domain
MKRLGMFVVVMMVAVCVSGCATGKQKKELQVLQGQVSTLQEQVQQKDAEIDSLRQALSRTTEQKYNEMKQAPAEPTIDVPSVSQIQTALKNAGYSVSVDGKMGKQTRKAVKDFQKANGLDADGKVGKKTWALMEPYFNKSN